MTKKKNDITILAIGDNVDFDSYKKLEKEKKFINCQGFDHRTVEYEQFLEGKLPKIGTEKVIVFFFFPFVYWDKNIEHKRYRGLYGNNTFYKKFNNFSEQLADIVRDSLWNKQILFVNNPLLSAFYRDKMVVINTLLKKGVPIPRLFKERHLKDINNYLEKGYKFFIKPRCGSMGKGITFLQLGDWQTNFKIRGKKIISRKSDYGWKFRDVTGNSVFLSNLLKNNVFMEEFIEPLNIRGDKVDFRVYTFFDKVLYIYPRRNHMDAVTTNISQGGRGDPSILDFVPDKLLSKIGKTALKTAKALKLNFTGLDVVVDSALKGIYVVDVNMFPGFPKRKTFNLTRSMIKELSRLHRKGSLYYEKGANIKL